MSALMLWINIPLMALAFALWVGVPLWLVLRHPATDPAENRRLPAYLLADQHTVYGEEDSSAQAREYADAAR
jgi:hypothetical protein